jgi:hypothetical protein
MVWPIRRKFLPVAVGSGKERPVDRKQMAAVLPHGGCFGFPAGDRVYG